MEMDCPALESDQGLSIKSTLACDCLQQSLEPANLLDRLGQLLKDTVTCPLAV